MSSKPPARKEKRMGIALDDETLTLFDRAAELLGIPRGIWARNALVAAAHDVIKVKGKAK